ncbi:MAG: hypothetical protein J6J55_04425 [Paludibacteraceae bacterium]|nr:hypothetical protein [Paludibacteraceae bacterium]MBP3575724.1 hypothetical protein [Paludibacteraceae bacterium]
MGFILIFVILAVALHAGITKILSNSNGNKFINLLPVWVIGYCTLLAGVCLIAFCRWWEGPEHIIAGILLLGSLICAILVTATLIVALIKKQYRNAILITLMGLLLIAYAIAATFFGGLGNGALDNFGKRHPIPEGMEYYTTKITPEYGNTSAQAYLDSLVVERGIVVVDYGQPGQYRYMANVPAIPEKGKIYLKLYEATTNLPLSEYIKYNTTIEVEASDTAVIYAMKSDGKHSMETKNTQYFTVQEGSWGDYYAARVELWYQPESGDEEQLLHSVIYQIEGWSR